MEVFSYAKEIPKKFIHNWIKQYDKEKICMEIEEYRLDTEFKILLEIFFLWDKLIQRRDVFNYSYSNSTGEVVFSFIDFRGVVVYQIMSKTPIVTNNAIIKGEILSFKDVNAKKCFIPPDIKYEEFLKYHKSGITFNRRNFLTIKKRSKTYAGNFGLIYSDINKAFEIPLAMLFFNCRYEYLDIYYIELTEDLIVEYKAEAEIYLQFNKYKDYFIEGKIDLINWKSVDYKEKTSFYS